MDAGMGMEALALLPEILLLAGALAVLLAGSLLPRNRLKAVHTLAIVTLFASLGAAVIGSAGIPMSVFSGTYLVDTPTQVVRIAVVGATALILLASRGSIAGSARESEIYALVLFSATGTVTLAGAGDLLVLAVAFLLASIPLYGLIGVVGTARGAEAALKTYLLGALFGILLLAGVTLVFAVAGTSVYAEFRTTLGDAPPGVAVVGAVAILSGLMFKAGAVPAHFWVPDAAQASSGLVATFLTTVPKLGAFIAAFRLVDALPDPAGAALFVGILAVITMTLGNLAAYTQEDPRRLLGWSTVGQAGFLLAAVAVAPTSTLALPALLFYVAAYAVTNVAAFAVTVALPGFRRLDDYRGLASSRPGLALALVVALLGLVGTPPTAVFIGKLTVVSATWQGGAAWLAVAILVNTVISLYYYLRWIIPLYRRAPDPAEPLAHVVRPAAANGAMFSAVLSVLLGIAAGLVFAVL